jgi:hypothetical protein
MVLPGCTGAVLALVQHIRQVLKAAEPEAVVGQRACSGPLSTWRLDARVGENRGCMIQGEYIQRDSPADVLGVTIADGWRRQCRTASVADEPLHVHRYFQRTRGSHGQHQASINARASLMHGTQRRLEFAHVDLGEKAEVPDVHPQARRSPKQSRSERRAGTCRRRRPSL